MPGLARTSPLAGRRRRAGTPSDDELRSRRHAGDFSHLAPILPESDRPLLSVPDYHKDLPRIPSTSTGLWGDGAVTVSTDLAGSLTASPVVGFLPLSVPSHHVYERVSITEAQQIAAQYRQRHRSTLDAFQSTALSERTTMDVSTYPLESLHASPSSTAIQSGVSATMNAPFGASSAPSLSSPTRRALAEETETNAPHEGARLFDRVREGGTVSCTRGDCLAVLPSSEAFLNHLHIHLIDEGYVVRPRYV